MKARRYVRVLALALLFAACAGLSACASRPARVLFLGNSLTYVGNLPAVLESVCNASGKRCRTEMVAEGGATLSQRIEDNSLSRSLQGGHKFDYLVLQERGGDYLPVPSQVAVTASARSAAETLTRQAVRNGIKPILLGTYQSSPGVSEDLVSVEAQLAATLGVGHVAISSYLACGRRLFPALQWFDPDGAHPGPDLTLLMAVRLYQEIFGTLPATVPLAVHAPIYGPMNSPRASSFASIQPVKPEMVRTVSYDAGTVRDVMAITEAACK